MNILIVGEFSAFAKHLKNGFTKLGHDVCIIHDGDGFKKIKPDRDDIFTQYKDVSVFGKTIPHSLALLSFFHRWRLERNIKKRFNNEFIDLIIVINYRFLSYGFFSVGVSQKFLKKNIKRGSKLIKTACGGDPAFRMTYPELMEIWGFNQHLDENDKRFFFLLEHANCIIPTIYSYYYSMMNFSSIHHLDTSKIQHPIPLPITIDNDYEINPCVNRKIVIFHGVLRPREKGTPIIQEAMNRIEKKYPDKVTCICKGGLPYDEYVKLFKSIDILIEQTYQNGWGVNATIGAMKAKCVLAPCGKENSELMNIPNIPFVQITPDSEQIFRALEDLVLNPQKIDSLKFSSRKFVEDYCDCSIIAKRYLDTVGLGDL